MKRFHLNGTAEITWSWVADAETEDEAREMAKIAVENGNATDGFDSIDIHDCDEEEGVFEDA